MSQVNVAYEILSDPEKRTEYDNRTVSAAVQKLKHTLHTMVHASIMFDMQANVMEGREYTFKQDLIDGISSSIQQASSILVTQNCAIEKLLKLKGRYKSKKGSASNFYEEVIEEQLKGLRGTIKKVEEEIEVAELCLTLVHDLESTMDDSSPRSSRAFFGLLG